MIKLRLVALLHSFTKRPSQPKHIAKLEFENVQAAFMAYNIIGKCNECETVMRHGSALVLVFTSKEGFYDCYERVSQHAYMSEPTKYDLDHLRTGSGSYE